MKRKIALPKLTKVCKGEYVFELAGRHFAVECYDEVRRSGRRCGVATWDLYLLTDGGRDWINDFGTRREAVEHAVAEFGENLQESLA